MTDPADGYRRLLVVGPEPPPYTGMEMATAALLEELARASVPVARVDTADPDDELGNRGRWTAHNMTQNVRHLLDAARLTLRRDVGAVYVPIAQETPAFYRDAAFILLARLARKPSIVHLHGGAFADFYAAGGRVVRSLVRASVGRATVGVVLSQGLRPALGCVMPDERIVVIENGIDVEADARSAGARGSGAGTTVLFLSSLFRWKGIGLFVEGFALAARDDPTLRAVAAGPWPDDETRREVLARVEALGIGDRIEFPGLVGGAEKTGLLASADIFCLPSLVHEGQPLVILEAMAAGLPVVATAMGGIPDVVRDGETGVLLERPEPALLADALTALAGDPDRRRRFGETAAELHRTVFTQRAFGDRFLALLVPLLRRA